jgi:hypothetical protein
MYCTRDAPHKISSEETKGEAKVNGSVVHNDMVGDWGGIWSIGRSAPESSAPEPSAYSLYWSRTGCRNEKPALQPTLIWKGEAKVHGSVIHNDMGGDGRGIWCTRAQCTRAQQKEKPALQIERMRSKGKCISRGTYHTQYDGWNG